MTTLTVNSMKASFWALLKSDTGALSVAARATLGAGANSILTKLQFRGIAPASLPARPFTVVQFGGVPGKSLDVRTLFPTVWLYDDVAEQWARLGTVQAAVEALYTEDCIPYSHTNYAGGIGDEQLDPALGIPTLALRYQVRARF